VGHHLRGKTHQPANGQGQRAPTLSARVISMPSLVNLHLGHDGSRPGVCHGQSIEVFRQVSFDLSLCLDHESKAPRIASPTR
jgi:hypothetical protein